MRVKVDTRVASLTLLLHKSVYWYLLYLLTTYRNRYRDISLISCQHFIEIEKMTWKHHYSKPRYYG